MKKEYFSIAMKNLKRRKLRSWLTILGILIAIATIFTLVSLSLGLENAVEEQFEILGADKFFIQPVTGFLGAPGSIDNVILTKEDVEAIKKVRGVKDVLETVAANAKIEFNDRIRYSVIWGMNTDTNLFIETGGYEIEDGRFINEGEGGVMLGNLHKTGNLWGKSVNVGNKIKINGEYFKVRGILEKIGNPDDDSMVSMDIEAFREFFDVPERVDWIVVQVEEGEDIIAVAERTEKELRDYRGLDKENQDFSVLTPEDLLESFRNILGIITYFLAGIAGISLFVGGIGIANTMYTSVLERTREIGIMKAVGAKNSDVLWIFLIESGLLGLVGGAIGIILGYGISKITELIVITQFNTNLLQVAAPGYLIIGCLLFSFVIGALSGTLPAIQASKTNVIDALRQE